LSPNGHGWPERSARAGLVSRGLAFVVDLGIVTATLAVVLLVGQAVTSMLGRLAPHLHLRALVLAFAPLIYCAYNVVFWEVADGQTPGKWLLGIQVVSAEGGRLRLVQAVARFFAYSLSALPFYLGFLWALGPRRLCWHDILARTAVVYRRAPERGRAGAALRSRAA
jgi:uncharacterized RDD family membrane protein YckC